MIKAIVWISLIVVALISPFVGVASIELEGIFLENSIDYQIMTQLRLPRVILAFFTGSILALSGLLFQTLFRNVLMTPYTLGVSSGAVLGAGVAIKLGLGSLAFGISAVTLFGLGGAWLSIGLILFLSRFLKHAGHNTLLLLGIALSFFYTSALTVLFYLSSYIQSHEILRFTMGSLSIVGFSPAVLVLSIALLLLVVVYFYRWSLQVLALSDEQAKLKGINSEKITFVLLAWASLVIGVMVSIVGPIGFVGLVVPHMVRHIYQRSMAYLILPTFVLGGLFLLGCDTIARSLSSVSEIPIGVVTALIGAPFFIYIIVRHGR